MLSPLVHPPTRPLHRHHPRAQRARRRRLLGRSMKNYLKAFSGAKLDRSAVAARLPSKEFPANQTLIILARSRAAFGKRLTVEQTGRRFSIKKIFRRSARSRWHLPITTSFMQARAKRRFAAIRRTASAFTNRSTREKRGKMSDSKTRGKSAR